MKMYRHFSILVWCVLLLSGCASLQEFAANLFRSKSPPLNNEASVVTSVPFLQRRVRMIFPQEIRTVGEAVDYLLSPYDFQPLTVDSTSQSIALYEYVPAHDVSAVPLFVAIKRLLGEEYKIVFDSREQLYAFQYKRLGDNPITFHDLSLLDAFVNTGMDGTGPLTGPSLQRVANPSSPYPGVVRPNANDAAEQRSFQVKRGSLRENAIRLTREADWVTDTSEWFLPYDFTVKTGFTIHYYSLDEAMTKLLKPYNVAAIFLDADRKVVFEEM